MKENDGGKKTLEATEQRGIKRQSENKKHIKKANDLKRPGGIFM